MAGGAGEEAGVMGQLCRDWEVIMLVWDLSSLLFLPVAKTQHMAAHSAKDDLGL